MLRYANKGEELNASAPVTPVEDALLRAAFGRYGGEAAAREAAVPVVRRYQQQGDGQWLLCDCVVRDGLAPPLVPVSQTHIRRHQEGRWPAHDESCDFYREPAQQIEITLSYKSVPAARPVRLVRPLERSAGLDHRRFVFCTRHDKRPGLARLLMQLMHSAGLQTVLPAVSRPKLVDQVAALWSAAKAIDIDDRVPLTDFLCTSPARLPELVARIEAAPVGRFVRTRPHGVLLARIGAIGNGMLQPLAGAPIPVLGRIAVFGEITGHGRETLDERAARAPYLAACIVARPSPSAPVEVLSAYVHPCASADELLLVDSDRERRTLAELRGLQRWIRNRRLGEMTIRKPLFDVAGLPEEGAAPLPPCIPDFVVRMTPRDGGQDRVVVVETMGYADAVYRTRKRRLHPLMTEACQSTTLLAHDFHEPAHMSQKDRDDRFWRELCRRLVGTGWRAPAPQAEGGAATERRPADAGAIAS